MTNIPLPSRIGSWILISALALAPIFFLPITQDFYDFNKWILMLAILVVAIILWAYRSLQRSLCTFTFSPFALGFGALTLASLVSLFVSSANKVEALLAPFGPVTFLACTLIVGVIPTLFDTSARRQLLWLVYGSVSILSLLAVYQYFGMGNMMFPGVSYLADPLWTPTGSTAATITICALTLPLLLSHVASAWKLKNEAHLGILAILSLTLLAGLIISFIQIVPRYPSFILPLTDGWTIMLEILKGPKQAIAGVGAENFLAAFAAGRSATLNATPLWNMRFTANATLFFHITTIYGLIGGGAFIICAKSFIATHIKTYKWSLIIGFIALFIAPPSIGVLIVLVILCILSSDSVYEKSFKLTHRGWQRAILTILVGGTLILTMLVVSRVYWAELLFFRSLRAAQKNNGTATYNLQMQAIQTNYPLSRFHMYFSQTNLALATSLADTVAAPDYGENTSDEEKTTDQTLIANLIEQSIREAKVAVSLAPYNVASWENLARTYQQLIGVAQGAENWTITTFNEAIRRDPTNPILHLELGIAYISTKQYPNAIIQFQQAIALKSNYVNAYYNLANAYTLNDDNTSAIEALEHAQSLVDIQSDDYSIISKELEKLRNP
jgi:cytochrome c-type biogenesis protein CcmH/NrfG